MTTLHFRATPVKHEQHDGYATTSFMMFCNGLRDIVSDLSTPDQIEPALRAWAEAHDPAAVEQAEYQATAGVNAWSISIVKPKRWPSGFKAAGERTYTFVVAQ